MNKHILIINASARGEKSISRKLSDFLEEKWKEVKPDDIFSYREIGKESVPHICENWIHSAFKPSHNRTETERNILKYSDKVISEIEKADVVVLSSPMYNWSIPSPLKAYIDQIVRVNRTLAISSSTPKNPYRGLLKNKKVVLILVRGGKGYGKGEFNNHIDFQTKYLQTVFKIMGINDIQTICVDSLDISNEEAKKSYLNSLNRITAIAHQKN